MSKQGAQIIHDFVSAVADCVSFIYLFLTHFCMNILNVFGAGATVSFGIIVFPIRAESGRLVYLLAG